MENSVVVKAEQLYAKTNDQLGLVVDWVMRFEVRNRISRCRSGSRVLVLLD